MEQLGIRSKPCPGCKRVKLIEVTESELDAYNRGALIQYAFPNLTSEQRESLITGYCNNCWNELFKEEK